MPEKLENAHFGNWNWPRVVILLISVDFITRGPKGHS